MEGDNESVSVSVIRTCVSLSQSLSGSVYGTCCLLTRRQRQKICTYSHTHPDFVFDCVSLGLFICKLSPKQSL